MKAVRRGSQFVSDDRNAILDLTRRSAFLGSFLILLAGTFLLSPVRASAQGSTYRVWGDVKIDDSKADTPGPATLTVILYDPSGNVVARQTVSNGGRYRFNVTKSANEGLFDSGSHEIAIESEAGEITRVRVFINGVSGSDFRQDFEFEWKTKFGSPKPTIGVISAADAYERPAATKSLFQKAKGAVEKKNYAQATTLLGEIVATDKLDFQAWTLLGTVYLVQEKPVEAEKAYLSAIEARPTFSLALLNLGRLRTSQKKYEQAIEPLTHAVEAQPQSAEANLLLGEAYLQIKKGSKAIAYLNEASNLGRPEAHLRLGWLYNAAGMKDKAAIEYAEFLKKKPDYSDRRKLEEYIRANKKV
ncbi:MAG: tetratricopeptide repeat protein [Pyrinomonadaceae bacterium]